MSFLTSVQSTRTAWTQPTAKGDLISHNSRIQPAGGSEARSLARPLARWLTGASVFIRGHLRKLRSHARKSLHSFPSFCFLFNYLMTWGKFSFCWGFFGCLFTFSMLGGGGGLHRWVWLNRGIKKKNKKEVLYIFSIVVVYSRSNFFYFGLCRFFSQCIKLCPSVLLLTLRS